MNPICKIITFNSGLITLSWDVICGCHHSVAWIYSLQCFVALSLHLGLCTQLWHSPSALWPYVHMVVEWWKSCLFSYSSLTYWEMERRLWSACGQRQWHTDTVSLSLTFPLSLRYTHIHTQLLVSSTDEFWENKQLQEEERTIRLDGLPNFIIYYGLPEMHTLQQPGACLRFTCNHKSACTHKHALMHTSWYTTVQHFKPLNPM